MSLLPHSDHQPTAPESNNKQFYFDEKVDEEEEHAEEVQLSTDASSSSNFELKKEKVLIPSRGDLFPLIVVYVIISAATGVHQDYHFHFAEYVVRYGHASNQTVIAVTYDYRGMGESRDVDKPTIKCSFYDWGKDFWGVMDFCVKYHQETFSQQGVEMEIVAAGNSIGAYLMMTIPSDLAPYFKRAFNGYFGYFEPFKSKKYMIHYLRTKLFFASVPLLTTMYGFFPSGTVFHSMEDIPTGVAYTWRQFQYNPHYMTEPGNPNKPILPSNMEHVTFLNWAFEDDVFTNKNSVAKYNEKFFGRCKEYFFEVIKRPVMKTSTPASNPQQPPKRLPIGHVGFFKKYVRDRSDLWKDACEFIIFGKITRTGSTEILYSHSSKDVPNPRPQQRISKL
ncbi:hypothetical protein C9374_004151 [Naegleria lovaniensis]|uniref:Serine aminopeptidase S33 domain-containing protein n=1 Tax=Naegleria lovaniensis TaxID=51637 RepID=A0AA88KLB4_NAELO|nr:uncharacterized protein C9374_004151 [Naegleria lovaniensis]KAG2383480.1 hypothetical protein C9374_004151 [Naegleria lovaniensis]